MILTGGKEGSWFGVWWSVRPALLNQMLRLNVFELVTGILKCLGIDEETQAARQEFRPDRSENLRVYSGFKNQNNITQPKYY